MTPEAQVRLGFIELSTSEAVSAEIPPALPPQALALITRMRLPGGDASADGLRRMLSAPRLEEACAELADGGCAVAAFACTTGSLLNGPGYDLELIERMRQPGGMRATTTSTALVDGLRAVGASRVAVATPYVPELNRAEQAFLEAAGFEVTVIRGLGVTTDPEIARVPAERLIELVNAIAGDADCVFISCTNLLTFGLLEGLERQLARPVLSSNAVTLWHCQQLAGLPTPIAGRGSLLSRQPPLPETSALA